MTQQIGNYGMERLVVAHLGPVQKQANAKNQKGNLVKLPQYYFNSFRPYRSMAERDMRHEKRDRKKDLLAGSR